MKHMQMIVWLKLKNKSAFLRRKIKENLKNNVLNPVNKVRLYGTSLLIPLSSTM